MADTAGDTPDDTPPRRGPYAKTTAQREAITRAALDHFGRYGYHGASVREIARAVGLSQAGLLHHFRSKEELLTATLEVRDDSARRLLVTTDEAGSDPLAPLVALVAHNAEHRNVVQLFTVVSAEATEGGHPAHAYFRARSGRIIASIGDRLQRAVDHGWARSDLDVETAARQCQALMYGLQFQWLLDPTTDMVGAFGKFLDDTIRPHRCPALSGSVGAPPH